MTNSLILALHGAYDRATIAADLLDSASEKVPVYAPVERHARQSGIERAERESERDTDALRLAILRQVPETSEELAIFAYHAWIYAGIYQGMTDMTEEQQQIELNAEVIFNFLITANAAGMNAHGKRFQNGAALAFSARQMRRAQEVDGEPVEPTPPGDDAPAQAFEDHARRVRYDASAFVDDVADIAGSHGATIAINRAREIPGFKSNTLGHDLDPQTTVWADRILDKAERAVGRPESQPEADRYVAALMAARMPTAEAIVRKMAVLDKHGSAGDSMTWASIYDDVRALTDTPNFGVHHQDGFLLQSWNEWAGLTANGEADSERARITSEALLNIPATTPLGAAAKLKIALWTAADDWLADAILGVFCDDFERKLAMGQFSERATWDVIRQLEDMD